MSYSLVMVTQSQSVDVVAPSAPGFVSVTQVSNALWKVGIQLPLTDADGSALTGLVKLTLATLPMLEGANPFTDMDMPSIINIPNVLIVELSLVEADAGQVKEIEVPVLNLGSWQAFACAVSD